MTRQTTQEIYINTKNKELNIKNTMLGWSFNTSSLRYFIEVPLSFVSSISVVSVFYLNIFLSLLNHPFKNFSSRFLDLKH